MVLVVRSYCGLVKIGSSFPSTSSFSSKMKDETVIIFVENTIVLWL